ncbi:MAG: hypothetical protein HKN00_03820 [Flavobacteriaceae bacterium]|nr:hypothetical protein [Bacteroidia bacterium]MBT8287105.1 hypothetical protein [Bacteroidia bacterium]NNF74288.1 hypothetical protein [Flavobacteriaceae bacterium]NNK73560.1 hypothetical protein [Flavobacteriaceae bacterium]
MGTFYSLFLQVFQYYKTRIPRHARKIALIYITLVQTLAVLILGVVLSKFLKSMHMTVINSFQAWVLFAVIIVVLYFNNWMQYTGRKQAIKKAKYNASKSEKRHIMSLWLIPILGIVLSIILMKLDA